MQVVRVGISAGQLVEYHPRLYHMAQEDAWDNIRKRGLLSTTALLDLFEKDGPERFVLESQYRPESTPIEHEIYGTAVIRDQKPMPESSLRRCLVGLTPRQWYEILNRKAFFWLSQERLFRLLSARAYGNKTHCILTVDTAQLVNRYSESIMLSAINSGSAIFKPQLRGPDTFHRLNEYPFEAWRKQRGRKDAIAELCVEYSVPDIAELVTKVAHMNGSRELEVLYER